MPNSSLVGPSLMFGDIWLDLCKENIVFTASPCASDSLSFLKDLMESFQLL